MTKNRKNKAPSMAKNLLSIFIVHAGHKFFNKLDKGNKKPTFDPKRKKARKKSAETSKCEKRKARNGKKFQKAKALELFYRTCKPCKRRGNRHRPCCF